MRSLLLNIVGNKGIFVLIQHPKLELYTRFGLHAFEMARNLIRLIFSVLYQMNNGFPWRSQQTSDNDK